MMDWLITETTSYCDDVEAIVTIKVTFHGAMRCNGYRRFVEDTGEDRKGRESLKGKAGKGIRCKGPECPRMTSYRDKLFSEKPDCDGQ